MEDEQPPTHSVECFSGIVRIYGEHEPGTCGQLNNIGFERKHSTGEMTGYGGIASQLAKHEGQAVDVLVEVQPADLHDRKVIELEEWVPTGDGMLRYVQGRLMGDIMKELWPHIHHLVDEYFNIDHEQVGKRWPKGVRWIACYAVTGGSEGWYVHIDAIFDGQRKMMFLGKTFMGMVHARKIADRCADLLGS